MLLRRNQAGIVAAVCLLGGMTMAQEATPQPKDGGMRGRDIVMKLALPPVQKELKLTPDQIARIKALGGEVEAIFDRMSKARSLDDSMEAYVQINRVTPYVLAKRNEILTEPQLTRFQQLMWQLPNAIEDPELHEKLAFSDDQKARLATIVKEFSERIIEARKGPSSEERLEESPAKRRERLAAENEKVKVLAQERKVAIDEVLTDEQKAEIAKLQGKPFKIPIPKPAPGVAGKAPPKPKEKPKKPKAAK